MVLSASLYSTANQNPLSFHPLLSPFLYTQTEEAVVTFLWVEHMTDLNVYKPVKKPLCISIITACVLYIQIKANKYIGKHGDIHLGMISFYALQYSPQIFSNQT